MRHHAVLFLATWSCVLPLLQARAVDVHYWKDVSPGKLTGASIAIDPANADIIYASFRSFSGQPAQVYRTTNAGTTWGLANVGLPSTEVVSLGVRGGRVYAATFGSGVYRSTDGGASWTAAGTGLSSSGMYAHVLAVDPSNAGVVYLGTWTGGIWKSTDSGTTWKAKNVGISTFLADVHALAIDPVDGQTVYAGCFHHADYAVYKSTNGGDSWAGAITGLPAPSVDTDVTCLAIDPDNPRAVYAGMDGSGVFKSTDAGASWRQASAADSEMASMGVGSLVIDPANSGIVYAGMVFPGYGVYKSTDDGSHWMNLQGPGTVYAMAIDPVNGGTLYTGSLDGIWKTAGPEVSFLPPQDISGMPDGIATMAAMAMDTDGHVHVAFVGWFVQQGAPDGVASEIFYTNNVGGTFGTPLKLPSAGTGSYSKEPKIALDAFGAVHIAYYRTDYQLDGTGILCYTSNAGGAFSPPFHSFAFAGSHRNVNDVSNISIEVDGSRQAFLATETEGAAMYTSGSGSSFSELAPVAPGVTDDFVSDVVLRSDHDRHIHVLVAAQQSMTSPVRLWYTNNAAGSFSTALLAWQTESTSGIMADLEIDPHGVAHIGYRQGASSIYYLNNASGSFHPPILTFAQFMQDLEAGSQGGLYMAAKWAGSAQSMAFFEWRDNDFIDLSPPVEDYPVISSQWNGGWFQTDDERGVFHFVYTTGDVNYVQARRFGHRSISPARATFEAEGGTGTVRLSCGACTWDVISTVPWISVGFEPSGSGDATVHYRVSANEGEQRIGKLIVGGLTLVVTQDRSSGRRPFQSERRPRFRSRSSP